MRSDHRRPLLAYVLVTLACAFVVAPSLDLGGLGLGSKPTFSAVSDPMMTPSELAGRVEESKQFEALPDAGLVDPPAAEDEDVFVPDVDVITDAVDELPWTMADGEAAGSGSQGSDDGVSQVVSDPPQAGSVVVDGPSGESNGSSAEDGGAAGGPQGGDADVTGGSGTFAPSDGGTVAGPGDGDGTTGGADDDPGHVAPGGPAAPPQDTRPNGHGPKVKGVQGHSGHGPKDKDPKDKEPKDKEPKDKDPKDKDPKDEDPKDKDPKDKGSQGKGSQGKGSQGKAHGHDKAHQPKGPKKDHPGKH